MEISKMNYAQQFIINALGLTNQWEKDWIITATDHKQYITFSIHLDCESEINTSNLKITTIGKQGNWLIITGAFYRPL